MATRGERLNRLVVSTPCSASWEGMEGDDRQRHCSLCRRDVLDFARLTEREIHAHLEASRGRLCARLTRSGGRLEIQPSAFGETFPIQRSERRASPLAATVVTAFLASGFASARAEAPPAPTVAAPQPAAEKGKTPEAVPAPAASAALRGRVADDRGEGLSGSTVSLTSVLDGKEWIAVTREDGTFVVEPLPAGIYDVRAELDGFDSLLYNDFALPAGETRSLDMALTAPNEEATVMAGAVAVAADPIRLQFQESEVVVSARVGVSRIVSRDGGVAEVETELLVDSTYKGRVAGRKALYRHSEYLPAGQATPAALAGELHLLPGARLLAFLQANPDDAGSGAPVFRASGYAGGIRVLDDSDREAYLGAIAALARLDRKAGGAAIDPEELMRWMVATAEDGRTRGEAAREIDEALTALDQVGAEEGKSREDSAEDLRALVDRFRAEGGTFQGAPRPAVLGAALTERQEARLTAALRKTETFREADVDLYLLVRRWDEETARKWLAAQVRDLREEPWKAEDHAEAFWLLVRVASDSADERLDAAAMEAANRRSEIGGDPDERESTASDEENGRAAAAIFEDLRARVLAALDPPD